MRLLLLIALIQCIQGLNTDWDLLIFTQRWPTTDCLQYEESRPNHVCVLPPIPSIWTIHGIWPTILHTEGPSFCNKSIKFIPEDVMPIREKLNNYWPNLEGGHTAVSLWQHEWLKHGSCAISLPALDSELKYFKTGLEWLQQYDMTSILADSGITPSDDVDYSLDDLNNAIVKKLNVRPFIACVKEKYSRKPYISELRICFDKNFNLIDCDGVVIEGDVLGNCPRQEKIRYPQKIPPIPTPTPSLKRRNVISLRHVLDILEFLDWIV